MLCNGYNAYRKCVLPFVLTMHMACKLIAFASMKQPSMFPLELNVGTIDNTLFVYGAKVYRHRIRDPTLRCIPCSDNLDICAQGKFMIFFLHNINEKHYLLQKAKKEYFISWLSPNLRRE